MKTIYLVAWLINAILFLIALGVHAEDGWSIIRVFNLILPAILLFVRQVMIHSNEYGDENDTPI